MLGEQKTLLKRWKNPQKSHRGGIEEDERAGRGMPSGARATGPPLHRGDRYKETVKQKRAMIDGGGSGNVENKAETQFHAAASFRPFVFFLLNRHSLL